MLDSLISGIFSTVNTLLNNSAKKRAINQEFENTVQLWNMNNEYNHPSQQMSRYKDAGLNPNLMYSNGQASAGNSSSTPSAPAAAGYESPLNNVIDTIEKIAQIKLAKENIKGQDLDNQGKETDNEIKKANLQSVFLHNDLAQQEYLQRSAMNPLLQQAKQVEIENMRNQVTAQNIANEIAQNTKDSQIWATNVRNNVEAQTAAVEKYTDVTLKYYDVQYRLQQIETEKYKQRNLGSSTALNFAKINESWSNIELNTETIHLKQEETKYAKIRNEIAEKTKDSQISLENFKNNLDREVLEYSKEKGYVFGIQGIQYHQAKENLRRTITGRLQDSSDYYWRHVDRFFDNYNKFGVGTGVMLGGLSNLGNLWMGSQSGAVNPIGFR